MKIHSTRMTSVAMDKTCRSLDCRFTSHMQSDGYTRGSRHRPISSLYGYTQAKPRTKRQTPRTSDTPRELLVRIAIRQFSVVGTMNQMITMFVTYLVQSGSRSGWVRPADHVIHRLASLACATSDIIGSPCCGPPPN